jgi:UDP-N-acetylglucosamine 1-carboxyvinyltransferase
MKQMTIEGNAQLSGTIEVSGSKNSAVALVPASLLSNGIVTLDNVPNISDIDALKEILIFLGAKIERIDKQMKIDCTKLKNKEIPESISKRLRASYYFMGALLGKYKHVEMYFPGGCSIGERPINLHLQGFEKMGATVIQDGNKYIIDAKELVGADIKLDVASVGATINIMLAASLANGITTIHNAAKEPHIVNVAELLNKMGAKISGAGSSIIQIEGVSSLNDTYHKVVPDYIEAGTYVIAGALCGNNLEIKNLVPEHIKSLTDKLQKMGGNLQINDNSIIISKVSNYKCIDVRTEVYPGFPTDLQQPFSVLLCKAKGVSTINETIFENRFMHIPYLKKMGANVNISDRIVSIYGPISFHGENVVATDLRAGASLILAALTASGTTTIDSVEHVLRGYENIVEKLENVGAKISIKEIY